jgi:hypothetical protein
MLCADNRRVMRTVDLALFSIFDLGSFGLPWVQAIIIAELDRPKRVQKEQKYCDEPPHS